MKRITMLAAILALVLTATVPALAQVTQGPTETFVSGNNANTGGAVQSSGSNSNTCAAQENFNNSGGLLNQPSLQQDKSSSGGIVWTGPSFTNSPNQTVPCSLTFQQSAASSSGK